MDKCYVHIYSFLCYIIIHVYSFFNFSVLRYATSVTGFYNSETDTWRNAQPSHTTVPNCVETRRVFRENTTHDKIMDTFSWNDRGCETPNQFVCERAICGLGFGVAVCEDQFRSSKSCRVTNIRRDALQGTVALTTASNVNCARKCFGDPYCAGVNYHSRSNILRSLFQLSTCALDKSQLN